jgi:hypothetical protein
VVLGHPQPHHCPSPPSTGSALHAFLSCAARYLQQRGWDVTYLPVEKDGRINLDQLAEAIRPDTALVSVMAVNNEIGMLNPQIRVGVRWGMCFWGGGCCHGLGKAGSICVTCLRCVDHVLTMC